MLAVTLAVPEYASAPHRIYVHQRNGTGDVYIGDFHAKYNSVAFLWVCAFFHLSIATWLWGTYRANVQSHGNPIRWAEYAISATQMVVQISVQAGGNDLTQLIGAAGCNVVMIACGYLTEREVQAAEAGGKADLKTAGQWPYLVGCVAGVVPWIGIYVNFGYAISAVPDAAVQAFVSATVASLFVWFMSFAVVIPIQRGWWCFANVGRGLCRGLCACALGAGVTDTYIQGEFVYVLLSMMSKSNLAVLTYFAPTPPQ